MTPEQIQQGAREAGIPTFMHSRERNREVLQAFATLVRNATLEEVNREVSGSQLLSNVAALEVQAILRKLKS